MSASSQQIMKRPIISPDKIVIGLVYYKVLLKYKTHGRAVSSNERSHNDISKQIHTENSTLSKSTNQDQSQELFRKMLEEPDQVETLSNSEINLSRVQLNKNNQVKRREVQQTRLKNQTQINQKGGLNDRSDSSPFSEKGGDQRSEYFETQQKPLSQFLQQSVISQAKKNTSLNLNPNGTCQKVQKIQTSGVLNSQIQELQNTNKLPKIQQEYLDLQNKLLYDEQKINLACQKNNQLRRFIEEERISTKNKMDCKSKQKFLDWSEKLLQIEKELRDQAKQLQMQNDEEKAVQEQIKLIQKKMKSAQLSLVHQKAEKTILSKQIENISQKSDAIFLNTKHFKGNKRKLDNHNQNINKLNLFKQIEENIFKMKKKRRTSSSLGETYLQNQNLQNNDKGRQLYLEVFEEYQNKQDEFSHLKLMEQRVQEKLRNLQMKVSELENQSNMDEICSGVNRSQDMISPLINLEEAENNIIQQDSIQYNQIVKQSQQQNQVLSLLSESDMQRKIVFDANSFHHVNQRCVKPLLNEESQTSIQTGLQNYIRSSTDSNPLYLHQIPSVPLVQFPQKIETSLQIQSIVHTPPGFVNPSHNDPNYLPQFRPKQQDQSPSNPLSKSEQKSLKLEEQTFHKSSDNLKTRDNSFYSQQSDQAGPSGNSSQQLSNYQLNQRQDNSQRQTQENKSKGILNTKQGHQLHSKSDHPLNKSVENVVKQNINKQTTSPIRMSANQYELTFNKNQEKKLPQHRSIIAPSEDFSQNPRSDMNQFNKILQKFSQQSKLGSIPDTQAEAYCLIRAPHKSFDQLQNSDHSPTSSSKNKFVPSPIQRGLSHHEIGTKNQSISNITSENQCFTNQTKRNISQSKETSNNSPNSSHFDHKDKTINNNELTQIRVNTLPTLFDQYFTNRRAQQMP